MGIGIEQPPAQYKWIVSWCGCKLEGRYPSYALAAMELNQHGAGLCPIGKMNMGVSEEDSRRLYEEWRIEFLADAKVLN